MRDLGSFHFPSICWWYMWFTPSAELLWTYNRATYVCMERDGIGICLLKIFLWRLRLASGGKKWRENNIHKRFIASHHTNDYFICFIAPADPDGCKRGARDDFAQLIVRGQWIQSNWIQWIKFHLFGICDDRLPSESELFVRRLKGDLRL